MNTNIALGIQRPRFNTGEDQRNALAIRGAQQQQVSNALAIQGQQEDRQIKREQMDFERQKYLASLDDAGRKRIAGEIDTFIQVSPLLMNEQTYGQGYSLLQQAAPSAAAKLPGTWTPELVPAIEGLALGAKGLLDRQQFEATQKTEADKFAYQKSQDAARMGLAREKLDWQKTKPGQGFSVTTPDGTVVNYGSGGAVTNKTQGEAENRMLEAGDTIAAVTNIRGQFRPEFQQIGTRGQMKVLALKDRAGTLNDDERTKLAEYSTYRAEAGQLMSGMLNQLFGAAISEQEMKRGESFLPNTGTGLFDGDSPTEMDSKLKRYEDFTRKALMKAAYIQRNGLTVDQVSIDQMPDLMRKRGDEISKEYAGLPPNEMMRAVKARLADEFGLVAY